MPEEKQHRIFLLGGRDLEMITIRDLLIEHGYKDGRIEPDAPLLYFDRDLEWGAQWSAYSDIVNNARYAEYTIYGIELGVDMDLRGKCRLVDHHNCKAFKRTSLLQVAELLGIKKDKLTERQKLVSANDWGHRAGLREAGATEAEIRSIRIEDLTKQGRKKEYDDFRNWVRDNEKNEKKTFFEIYGVLEYDIMVFENLDKEKIKHLSFIMELEEADKYPKILVYNDNKLFYRGTYANMFDEKELNDLADKIYYVGGEEGYLETKGKLNEEDIETIKNKIIDHAKSPFSHHIFLFPFSWELHFDKQPLHNISFEKRTNLEELKTEFEKHLKTPLGDWKEFSFKIGEARHYNEFTYFYEHVRPAIIANYDNYSGIKNSKSQPLLQYELNFNENQAEPEINKMAYLIEILKEDFEEIDAEKKYQYALSVEQITLNFYYSGIGIMAFHLSNYYYYNEDDILRINDYGRRLYPQYLGDDSADVTLSPKLAFLANRIGLVKNFEPPSFEKIKKINNRKIINDFFLKTNEENKLIEDFGHYKRETQNLTQIDKDPVHLACFVSGLLGNLFKTILRDANDESKEKEGFIYIMPVIDDRMFVVCWYKNQQIANELKNWRHDWEGKPCQEYQQNAWWYKYIFADNDTPGLANRQMLRQLNTNHTYDRWTDWGTYFGLSRYSLVMLVGNGKFAERVLYKHIQTVYFQMVMLALVQRASVLRYSRAITSLSSKYEMGQRQLREFQELRAQYLNFLSIMYFMEPGAQEQGIELYNELSEKMGLEKSIKDLDFEIGEVHRFVQMRYEGMQSQEINYLTWVSVILLPVTVIITILGICNFDLDNLVWGGNFDWQGRGKWLLFAWSFSLLALSIFSIVRYKRHRWWVPAIAFLFLLICVILLLIF